MVVRQHFLQFVCDFLAERGGGEDFEVAAAGEEFLFEIEGGFQVVFEDGVVICGFDFPLGMVEGEGADVLAVHAEDFDTDGLRLFGGDDAEAVGKVGGGVEVFGVGEGGVGGGEAVDAVEGEGAEGVPFFAEADDVPALPEYFDAVGLDGVDAGGVVPVALVQEFDFEAVAHGFDDGCEELAPGGDFFEEDAAFEVMAFVDEVIDGEGVEEPVADASFFHVFGVFDVIVIAAPAVAFDVDVEDLFDGSPPVVEIPEGHVFAVAQLGAEPAFVDFFECDFPCAVDGVYEPDVFVK